MTEHSRRDIASFVSALGFIVLGGLALYYTRGMSPLGSVFPRAIGSAMIVFSAVYIVWRWFKPHLGAEVIGAVRTCGARSSPSSCSPGRCC